MSAVDVASGQSALAESGEVPAVRLEGVTRRFGKAVAVRDLDLHVPRGSIFGLIGPNGAGKTTTFAMLATLLRPTTGSIEVFGLDPVSQARHVRARLGWLPDRPGFSPGVRVAEELRFAVAAHRLPRRSRAGRVDTMLDAVGLAAKRDAAVASLSLGERQRLGLARALVHDPDLVLLDEPAAGLDPQARTNLRALLVALRDAGRTVLLSSHILGEVQQICDEVAILHHGRVVSQGSPAAIAGTLRGIRRVRVRLATGVERIATVSDDDAAQAALLARLLAEGLEVVEFQPLDGDLEAAFLRVTGEETG